MLASSAGPLAIDASGTELREAALWPREVRSVDPIPRGDRRHGPVLKRPER